MTNIPGSDFALLREPLVDGKGMPTKVFRDWLWRTHVQKNAADLQGIVTPAGADFSRAYVNKALDNIPDGPATYARPLMTRVNAGRPLIDFSENIHLHKVLDNIGDGVTWRRVANVNANNQVGSQGGVQAINTPVSTTQSFILNQSGTSTTINVGSFIVQYGFGQVPYNSGSVNPGAYGTYYIYFSDPTFAGGTVTFLSTTNAYVANGNDGYVLIGSITTSAGGGGQGGKGGNGHQIN